MSERKPKGYWNIKENCIEAAKKCGSRFELQIKCPGAYWSSRRNGWLDEYDWFETPIVKQHMEDDYVIYSYEDRDNNTVYVGLTNNIRIRHYRHKEGEKHKGTRKFDTVAKYFQSIGKEMPNPVIKMDGLTAQQAQYYEGWYVDGYKRAGWTVINKSKAGSLGGTYVKWTYDKCKEEASKYPSRKLFQIGSIGAYTASYKRGWLNDFFGENCQKPKNYWNYENCYEEAKKYDTRSNFLKGNAGAYTASYKKGWLDDYDWFTPTSELISIARKKKKEAA